MFNLEDVLSKLSVTQTHHRRGSGDEPLAARRFFVTFLEKSYFNTIGSHFSRVQKHLTELDF